MTALRPSVVGALTGAVLCALGRVVVTGLHVYEISHTTIPALLVVAVLGLVIGGIAGLTARPLLGAIVGAILSAIVYVATSPIVLLFHALGAITPPSLVEVVAVGGLAGALGGGAARLASRRSARPRVHH